MAQPSAALRVDQTAGQWEKWVLQMVVLMADQRVPQKEHQRDLQKEQWLVDHSVLLMADNWVDPWALRRVDQSV